ncbi:recombinase family protein [Aeromicrobium sp. CF4.19]|uniref:recombinase family protein n=1 Tax=Aeromicrobium sp. CF4.19 TaxID=3373082 RepID=UPI003EE4AEE4
MTDRGYERISLDNERSGSISKQTSRIEAFGSEVIHYTDESVSGSKIPFAERPAGKRLLDDLRPGDRVLVTKIDRAARNVRDLLDLVERIEAQGASIAFIEQNIDTAGPMGRFLLTLLGAIAELEAGIIGERRRESLTAFAREGRHAVGAAPFGFKSVDNPNGRGLVIRPDWDEQAPILKSAIDRVLTGEAQARVVEDLPIGKAGFSALLRNPRLAGMTPEGDGVVTIDGVPRIDPDAALLTMAEWNRLREHMNRPDKKPWAHQDGYGAALTCSECGFRLYKSSGGVSRPNNNAYKCGRAKHAKGSPSASVMVHTADSHIEQTFLSQYGSRDVLIASWTDSADTKTEAIASAQIHLEAAQQAFLADLDDEQEDEVLQALRDAKRALRAAQNMPEERVFQVQDAGYTVAEHWERGDAGERCRMLGVVGKWIVHPGRLPVERKIEHQPDAMLLELLTHQVGSQTDALHDQNTFLMPA